MNSSFASARCQFYLPNFLSTWIASSNFYGNFQLFFLLLLSRRATVVCGMYNLLFFLPCARASLASWFVAAAPLRFAMPNMQRHYLSINTRPKCSNCNCNCNHSNNNNNFKSNYTLWHETHSTPGLVVCARFVGPQLWKFFKWCQITRCGHFLILILLLLLLLYFCFGHVQAGFSIWRVNWKRDSGVFFSPFLGQWPMFVLARFFASQPLFLCLPLLTLIRFLFGPKKNIRGGSRIQQVSPYDGTRSILIWLSF